MVWANMNKGILPELQTDDALEWNALAKAYNISAGFSIEGLTQGKIDKAFIVQGVLFRLLTI